MIKMTLLAFAAAATLLTLSPFSYAREKVSVDSALNASLKDRDHVQQNYKRSSARSDERRRAGRDEARRIKLEVGDELGSVSGGGGSEEAFAFRSRSRDDDTSGSGLNVEEEMREIYRAVGRELKRAPNAEVEASEGESLSESDRESLPAPSAAAAASGASKSK